MTLDKAIEIVAKSAYGGVTTFNSEFKNAQKVLIEAGKRLREHRVTHMDFTTRLLPGETK